MCAQHICGPLSVTATLNQFKKWPPQKSYRPLKEFPALFDSFARKPPRPKGMLDFCNKFGPLEGNYRNAAGGPIKVKTACDRMLFHHACIHEAVLAFELKQAARAIALCNSHGLAKAGVRLERNSDGAISVTVVPEDLIQAMWLQFALHITSGTHLLQCEHCGTPFVVGTRPEDGIRPSIARTHARWRHLKNVMNRL